jgi:hypothetical protein
MPRSMSTLDDYLLVIPRSVTDTRYMHLIDWETQRIVAEAEIPSDSGYPILVPAHALAGILEAHGAGDD